MDQHLTVREACKFSGKSASTIKRLIREINGTEDHRDRLLLLPSPEEVESRRKAGDTFVWKINQQLLIQRFPKEVVSNKVRGASQIDDLNQGGARNATVIVEVLRDQLESKDRQIQTLETQLDRKDEQIKSLNERMHESNVLMRELQNRLAISPPQREQSISAVPTQSTQKKRGVNEKPKERRPFFGVWLKRR